MTIKCNVIVDAWLGKIQILVIGCEVGIFKTMPAIKLYTAKNNILK